MKKINLVIAVLLVLLLPYAVSAFGNISVSSSPSGAQIFVDSNDKGVTPKTLVNITSGTRNILLQKSGFQNNQTSVIVVDGETVTLFVTLISSTTTPTISSITPSSGINNGLLSGVDIIGTGFSTSPTVKLNLAGQSNISGLNVNYVSPTQITCGFPLNGATAGTWNVIVTNSDGGTVTKTGGFTIINASTASTVTSIIPNSGTTNTTVTISSLEGTGFQTNAKMRLTRGGYNPIIGLVTGVSATQITGSFDLSNQVPGTWIACVLYDGTEGNTVCGPTFTINSAASTINGSIFVKSSPSISKIFLSNVYQGYTPMTLDNITPGTYTVLVRSAGYRDYSESVKVTAGNTSLVIASLVLSPEVTTVVTTAPKTTVATVKTTAKSTAKVPTPWPSATATPASPVSIFVIIGSVGMGLVVLRKG